MCNILYSVHGSTLTLTDVFVLGQVEMNFLYFLQMQVLGKGHDELHHDKELPGLCRVLLHPHFSINNQAALIM